jgi:hypothetical protein
MDQRGKTPDRQKKKNPTRGMDVCVVLYKDSSMDHKWHEGQKKGLNSTNNGSKGKTPGIKKKSHRGALMFVLCLL